MVFTAKTERGLLFCLLLVLISLFWFFDFSEWILYLQILFIILILALLLIQYKLEIQKKSLSLQNCIYYLAPLQKNNIPESNHQNIRVVLFTPKKLYEELMNFADRNNVSYFKTKDYTILEK